MRETKRPRISVLMPVYNAARYLAEAVSSILDQSFGDFEFVIVNDGSTDSSGSIIRGFADRDLRIVVHEQANAGIVAALNAGLARTRGELVARMDADDISVPTRIACQVRFMDEHPDCIAAGSDLVIIDPDGAALYRRVQPRKHEEIDAQHLRGEGGAIAHPSVVMRREAVCRVGGYQQRFRHAEDLDLFLRLAELGHLANVPEPLLKYRVHLNSVSYQSAIEQRQRTLSAVGEARSRRGLAAVDDRQDVIEERSAAAVSRKWAWWALAAGNVRTARKHALAALRRTPWSSDSWKVMACALRGH